MNIQNLTDNFQKSFIDNLDVNIKLYCEAYKEFSKLLLNLGSIFSFVVQDVESKIEILETLNSKDPEGFKTLLSMVSTESRFVRSQTNNGCRTFLRLHRALKFLYFLFDRLLTDDGGTLKEIVNESYDQTLAQYHPWLIRKGVKVAVNFLPYKEKLIDSIINQQPDVLRLNTKQGLQSFTAMETIPILKNIFNCCEEIYTKNKLHDLP